MSKSLQQKEMSDPSIPGVDLLKVIEVANLLGAHPNTVRALISSGKLRAVRFGRNIRINRQDVFELLTPYQGGEYGIWKKSAIGN